MDTTATKVSERPPAGELLGKRRFRTLVLTLCGAAACRAGVRPHAESRARNALGAVFSVAAWGPDSSSLSRAVDRAFATVQQADSEPDDSPPALDSVRKTVALETGLQLEPARAIQGLALDRALITLRGIADSAILSLGGQYLIMAAGARHVGVADPANSLRSLAVITVPPGIWSVSTVSLVEQSDPVLDPRTGKPADLVRAVTVVAGAAAVAGAWSTAFYVVGCDRALALAARAGVGVLCADDRIRWSPELNGRVAVATDSAGSAGTAPAPAPGRARAAAAAARGPRATATRSDSSR
jgi:thiamine biosynthesis lipoprotein ApbE